MRVIGAGPDYYDSALRYGRDEHVVLIREKNRVMSDKDAVKVGFMASHLTNLTISRLDGRPVNRMHWYNDKRFRTDDYLTHTISTVTVYLCGKRYSGIRAETEVEYNSRATVSKPLSFLWNEDALTKWMAERGHAVAMERPLWGNTTAATSLADFFRPTDVNEKLLAHMMENRITVATHNRLRNGPFTKEEEVWRVNGDDLKAVQFYLVLDAFQAFQTISQWVANLALPGRDMVEITDDRVKIHKAGFDVKTSFRKGPSGK